MFGRAAAKSRGVRSCGFEPSLFGRSPRGNGRRGPSPRRADRPWAAGLRRARRRAGRVGGGRLRRIGRRGLRRRGGGGLVRVVHDVSSGPGRAAPGMMVNLSAGSEADNNDGRGESSDGRLRRRRSYNRPMSRTRKRLLLVAKSVIAVALVAGVGWHFRKLLTSDELAQTRPHPSVRVSSAGRAAVPRRAHHLGDVLRPVDALRGCGGGVAHRGAGVLRQPVRQVRAGQGVGAAAAGDAAAAARGASRRWSASPRPTRR